MNPKIREEKPEESVDNGEHHNKEQLFYPDPATWVSDWGVPVFLRKDNQTMRWCPQWWKHSEAAVVLMALWEAWEV